jgi:hypothetical protein
MCGSHYLCSSVSEGVCMMGSSHADGTEESFKSWNLPAPFLTLWEDEKCLQNIMTDDKMWVDHYEHGTKRQSITKVHLQKRKFKTQAWAGKVMATVSGM